MMPGRRRVRYIALLFVFVVVAFVYFKRAQVEEYGSVVAEQVVGGGAVLRKPQEQQKPQVAPTTSPPAAVAADQAIFKPTHAPTRIAPVLEAEVERSSSSSPAVVPATTGRPVVPALLDDKRPQQVLPTEAEDARKLFPTFSTTHGQIHWTKEPEHFPISSTIPLPTGSPKAIPKIQYQGTDAGKADSERLAIIKAATSHAWNGYRDAAFGADEVKPISGGQHNPFNGWGATLVDSLDTLWIMGMIEEFDEAVEVVRKIDFTTSPRSDIPLFETVIRYLGGLVAAYDISGKQSKYQILLDQAVQLAEILYGAFDTPNRMPQTFYRWKSTFSSQPHRAGNRVVLAELGSLSVEFTRLAQLTGEPKYYDAIARITDAFEVWQNNTRVPGMWPIALDASGCQKPAQMAYDRPIGSSRTQQLVPGGNGVMEAAEPVRQIDREKVPGPADTSEHWTRPKGNMVAPGRLDSSETPGASKFIGNHNPPIDGSVDHKSNVDVVDHGLGSTKAKAKRQLDHLSSNEKQFLAPPNSTQHKQELREDTRTGQDVCIPRGLASTSEFGMETFTLGGQSDSTYEYLPKEYLLLGGLVEQYRTMYEYSANTAIKHLMVRPMTPENLDILIAGELKVLVNQTTGEYRHKFEAKSEHLTCFAGGMFAMGGKIFDRPDDVELGRKLTDGCIWGYNSTTTGIMPEIFTAMACKGLTAKECQWDEKAYWKELDPLADSRTKIPLSISVDTAATAARPKTNAVAVKATVATENKYEKRSTVPDNLDRDAATLLNEAEADRIRQDGYVASDYHARPYAKPSTATHQPVANAPSRTSSDLEQLHYTETHSTTDQIYQPKAPLSHEEFVRAKIADDRLPPGFLRVNAHNYILRPEAVESVFYMYRITGEQHWRDAGWEMFEAIDSYTRALYGNAAIDDVTKAAPDLKDSMESFWIAETLKYFYLLFDDKDTWSLDDWVLNTEAHFFRRPG